MIQRGIRLKFCQLILTSLLILISICIWRSLFYVGGEVSLEKYSPLILMCGSLLLILSGVVVAHILGDCSGRTRFIITIAFFVVIIIELLLFGFYLKYIPSYDLIHIKAEAIDMLNTGKISNIAYYAKYPNQQPLTILLFFIFSIARFLGFTDYNTVGIICNMFAILISVGFVYKICCFWSAKAGVISLFFFMADPMLFSWASYYYTDTFCMPFMLGGIWLFIKAEKTESIKKKALLMITSGFIITIGGKIRITAAFALIAIGLWSFIKLPFGLFLKKTGILLIGAICAILLSGIVLNTYGIKNENYEYPITHWIKLGLNEKGDGAYTVEDDRTTKAQAEYEDKIKENVETIQNRLKELGIYGIERLYLKKMTRTWATGAYTEPLQRTVEDYNTLYKYVIGRSSVIFNYWLQIVRCVMLILTFAGGVFELKHRKKQNVWMFILILGGIVFYLFWEAKPKYSLCFLPVFYIIESYSITNVTKIKEFVFMKNSLGSINSKQILKKIGCFIFLFTIGVGILTYSKYMIKQSPQEDLRVNQTSFSWEGRINEISNQGVTQSFMSDGDFNRIKISFLNPKQISDQNYILEIQDKNKNALRRIEFSSNNITSSKMHTFKIKKINVECKQRYYLKIYPKQEYTQNIGVNSALYSLYNQYKEAPDYYPEGQLYHKGNMLKNNDLTFLVLNECTDSTFSPYVFFSIWGALIIIEIGISIYFSKNIIGDRRKK